MVRMIQIAAPNKLSILFYATKQDYANGMFILSYKFTHMSLKNVKNEINPTCCAICRLEQDQFCRVGLFLHGAHSTLLVYGLFYSGYMVKADPCQLCYLSQLTVTQQVNKPCRLDSLHVGHIIFRRLNRD